MRRCFAAAPAAVFVTLAYTLSAGAAAQTPPAQQQAPTIKKVSAAPIVSIEGKDNFQAYCAVCHGLEGKGDGPAAAAMKVGVPDLTLIAARNKGKFNSVMVEQIIRGIDRMPTPAHGIEDMPVWGAVFAHEGTSRSTLRIVNLVKYLESIQVSPAR